MSDEMTVGSVVIGSNSADGMMTVTKNEEKTFMTSQDFIKKLVHNPYWMETLQLASQLASQALEDGDGYFDIMIPSEKANTAYAIFEHFGFGCGHLAESEVENPEEGYTCLRVMI